MIWIDLDGVLRDYVSSMGFRQEDITSYYDPRLNPPDPDRLISALPYEGALSFFHSLPSPKGICTCAPLETVEPWLRRWDLWPVPVAWVPSPGLKLLLGGVLVDDHPFLEGRPRVVTVGRPWNGTEWRGWGAIREAVLLLTRSVEVRG